MAKWFSPELLDNGLNKLVNDGNQIHLLSTYAAGDSYAVVTSTNSLGSVALDPADKTLQNGALDSREVVIGAKTITGATASGASPDLHVAIVDTANSVVVAVTDETSDQEIFGGNNVNIPSFAVRLNQPA